MELFYFVHLFFMPLGFFLLAAGIITVRYLKKKLWWFHLHKMLGVLATVFFLMGGMAAILLVRASGGEHLALPHTWLGAVTLVLMVGTLAAGFLQTHVVNKKRVRLVHRNAGRTVAILALVSVVTGAMAAGIIPGP